MILCRTLASMCRPVLPWLLISWHVAAWCCMMLGAWAGHAQGYHASLRRRKEPWGAHLHLRLRERSRVRSYRPLLSETWQCMTDSAIHCSTSHCVWLPYTAWHDLIALRWECFERSGRHDSSCVPGFLIPRSELYTAWCTVDMNR